MDVGIVEIGDKAVALTTDPVFIVPEYGFKRAAWFAIHILASDSVTSGLKPRYISIDLNLPMEMTRKQLEIMWRTMHKECKKLGIAVITGHTARYENCGYPMVGGATMVGIGELDEYVTPAFARAGDKIIITKGPAIESTGILALQAEKALADKFGKDLVEKAKSHFTAMTVVQDALVAAPYAHAMHDATEGGLLNGIYEVVEASNTGVTIYEDRIIIPEEIASVHQYFNIDPLISISEGTLVITATPENTPKIIGELSQNGISAWEIGEVTAKDRVFVRKDGKKEELIPVKVDPFWAAYFSTLEG